MQIHTAFKRDPPAHVIKNLLLAFPDASREKDPNGMLPLHHAAMQLKTSTDGFKVLLKAYPSAVSVQDDHGRLPVHLACQHGAPQRIIDMLFKNSPLSVSVKDRYGKTPLCYFKEYHDGNRTNQQQQHGSNNATTIYNTQAADLESQFNEADDGSYTIVPVEGELTIQPHHRHHHHPKQASQQREVTFDKHESSSRGNNTRKSSISAESNALTERTEGTSTVASNTNTKNLEAIIRKAEVLLQGLKEASDSVSANNNKAAAISSGYSTADMSTLQSTTVTGKNGTGAGGGDDAVSVITTQSWKGRPGFLDHNSNGQYWRDLILGFNDGLVSTFLLMAGVSGGGLSVHDIFITGVAGAVGGAISMASGEYLATKSQDEVEQAEIEREKLHIVKHRHDELRELRELLVLIGMHDDGLRKQLTEYYAKDDEALLQIMTVLEFGILEEERRSPVLAAVVSGITFTVGALPSVLPYAFVSEDDSFLGLIIAGILTGIGLAFAGAIKTTATNGSVLMAAGENVMVAGIGGLIAFYVGELFGLIA